MNICLFELPCLLLQELVLLLTAQIVNVILNLVGVELIEVKQEVS